MDQVLGDLQPRCAVVYIDDITIFSSTPEQHLIDVGAVLQRLDKANLKVNVNKCRFAMNQVTVLGHLVLAAGIEPNPEKIQGIRDMKPPTNVTEVKRFLGMINFYRRFVPDLASLVEPMVELTRGRSKRQKVNWEERHQSSFELVKKKLSSAPILQFPNMEAPFFIETDASDVGLGAVLTQVEPKSNVRMPVAFASRSLKKAERNYSTTDKEGLAVVWAVKLYRPYILGSKFTVITDHNALKALKEKVQLDGRLAQWADFLMEFDFDVVYRPGKENLVADNLSRALSRV